VQGQSKRGFYSIRTMADAMELSKQVYDILQAPVDDVLNGSANRALEMKAFFDAHPQVNVNLYRDERRHEQALHYASTNGHAACVRMLLDHGADVHASNEHGWTALMCASICSWLECMQILIEAKSDVHARTDSSGFTAVHYAAGYGLNPKCLQLLIDNHADVNARGVLGRTPAMGVCEDGILPCLQLLVDNKADLNVRDDHQRDALYQAIKNTSAHPSTAFAVLCCNTDAKTVKIDEEDRGAEDDEKEHVTEAKVAACIEEYKHTQGYIDEYHRILNLVLSEHVPVDPRFGLGQMGIYQEPLERALEYMGLSMNKDQVVNASIDGEEVKRALIPFHVLNAEMWQDKYQAR
jgi:hypothetical protein